MRRHPSQTHREGIHLSLPRRHRRRATAAVEFAVSLTVLMFFVFTAVEFFRASMLRHTADCAAYEAARAAICPGVSSDDALAVASNYLATVGVTPASVTVSPDPIDRNTTQVQVEVQIAMAANSWVTPAFLTGKMLIGRSRLMTARAPILLASGMSVPSTAPSEIETAIEPEATAAQSQAPALDMSSASPPPML
ncbi:MAG: TadE/TadG family type IV pilus assembly protein [Planctomycetaceae bacterium]